MDKTIKMPVRKKCKHCGKYNEYDLKEITFDKEDAMEFLEDTIRMLQKLKQDLWLR